MPVAYSVRLENRPESYSEVARVERRADGRGEEDSQVSKLHEVPTERN